MKASRVEMTPAMVRQILEEYYRPLPVGMEEQVRKYMDLLEKWGAKMSLTAIREPEGVVRAHFGESIFALSLGQMPEGRLADVGTGAGFPGLALKLALPERPVTLIEPNKKKCAFLHEVARNLSLTGVEALASSFRDAKIERNSLAVVTSRALGFDESLLEWAHTVLGSDGWILLWLGEEDSRTAQGFSGLDWGDPTLIPGTKARYILKGQLVNR